MKVLILIYFNLKNILNQYRNFNKIDKYFDEKKLLTKFFELMDIFIASSLYYSPHKHSY